MSIADGSFDGNFRHRLLGKDKQKADGGQGFKVPTQLEQKTYLEKVKVYENNVFEVPSLSEEDSWYRLLCTLYSKWLSIIGWGGLMYKGAGH